MESQLQYWLDGAEIVNSVELLKLRDIPSSVGFVRERCVDLYFTLVGEFFDLLRAENAESSDWASVAHGLEVVARQLDDKARPDALFFSAVAFYMGGYPASAYLVMSKVNSSHFEVESQRAAHEFLIRPEILRHERNIRIVEAIRKGDVDELDEIVNDVDRESKVAFMSGPEEWVAFRLYEALLRRFRETNLRTVLAGAGNEGFWNPLVDSFLKRKPMVMDFFPSQVEAIRSGLLSCGNSASVQMPTGAGKTALTEVIAFAHLARNADKKAVLLVPYRALARELRCSLGAHMTEMGFRCCTIYGGVVPSKWEKESLADANFIISTPEAFIGVAGEMPDLLESVSLVICDEGHLLDDIHRGIGLELLLARLKARRTSPRIVFVSAIVPNMEEIAAWIGDGSPRVLRSAYRATRHEYGLLRVEGEGVKSQLKLERCDLKGSGFSGVHLSLLGPEDFKYTKASSGRQNTYSSKSKKAKAIAVARSLLSSGPVAIFTPHKGGNAGVHALAEEFLKQRDLAIPLADPLEGLSCESLTKVRDVVFYLQMNYGEEWIGVRALREGVLLHYGDIPQETREIFEQILIDEHVQMLICTNTLAEGVNLPLRSIVLHSLQRFGLDNKMVPMKQRDIKNLIGRVGRAGSSTRGLIVCLDEGDWRYLEPVVMTGEAEAIGGALLNLIKSLMDQLSTTSTKLTNVLLENSPALFPLIDAVDSALIELISEEIGIEDFKEMANSIISNTFADTKASDREKSLLRETFHLRAQRLMDLRVDRGSGVLAVRSVSPRLVEDVLDNLIPKFDSWTDIKTPLNEAFINSLVVWALDVPGFREVFQKAAGHPVQDSDAAFLSKVVAGWIAGDTFFEISSELKIDVDRLLQIHSRVILYEFKSLVEQAVVIVQEKFQSEGKSLSQAVVNLPDYLRFGVPNVLARELMMCGLRHRQAAVKLSQDLQAEPVAVHHSPSKAAFLMLREEDSMWRETLGDFVYERSIADLEGQGKY